MDNQMNDRLLVFKKWQHPLKNMSSASFMSMDNMDDEGDEEGVIMTPEIPTALFFDPDQYLHLWTADTNFYVTKQVRKVVCTTPGVAYYKAMTPYRFIMGVGELFNQNTVKKEVAARLMVEVQDDYFMNDFTFTLGDHISVVERLKEQIKAEFWAIYLFPNGKTKVITSQCEDESFAAEFALLQQIKENFGGHIVSYLDG